MSLVGSRGGELVPVFGSGLHGGIRLTFIGWFLNDAAVLSDRQLVVRESPAARASSDG